MEDDDEAASRPTACIRAQAAAHHDPFTYLFLIL